jgi:PPOX class probable F420-dependent enzyme
MSDVALTDEQRELFHEPNLAHFVTLMPDGAPQVTPVWVDERDGRIWINTAEGRVKSNNIRRDPRVAVLVVDRNDPYRWVEVRGRVVEYTREGADDHIDFLSAKYTGREKYRNHVPGQFREILKIQPERVSQY